MPLQTSGFVTNFSSKQIPLISSTYRELLTYTWRTSYPRLLRIYSRGDVCHRRRDIAMGRGGWLSAQLPFISRAGRGIGEARGSPRMSPGLLAAHLSAHLTQFSAPVSRESGPSRRNQTPPDSDARVSEKRRRRFPGRTVF